MLLIATEATSMMPRSQSSAAIRVVGRVRAVVVAVTVPPGSRRRGSSGTPAAAT
ncbi:Uncharacterised protein [Mycobacteroides abscessus]|nr:Uncharacterised protein [Mycobacteroides abscessus]